MIPVVAGSSPVSHPTLFEPLRPCHSDRAAFSSTPDQIGNAVSGVLSVDDTPGTARVGRGHLRRVRDTGHRTVAGRRVRGAGRDRAGVELPRRSGAGARSHRSTSRMNNTGLRRGAMLKTREGSFAVPRLPGAAESEVGAIGREGVPGRRLERRFRQRAPNPGNPGGPHVERARAGGFAGRGVPASWALVRLAARHAPVDHLGANDHPVLRQGRLHHPRGCASARPVRFARRPGARRPRNCRVGAGADPRRRARDVVWRTRSALGPVGARQHRRHDERQDAAASGGRLPAHRHRRTALLGVSRQTLCMLLGRLQEHGQVDVGYKRIRVL